MAVVCWRTLSSINEHLRGVFRIIWQHALLFLVHVTLWLLTTSICRRLKEAIGAKDREIHSLRRQLDAGCEELTDAGRSREVALRENRRLQDDLAIMTRENQVCICILCFLLISFELIDVALSSQYF
jgi:hypothetical protein